jgi:hypothetical protein
MTVQHQASSIERDHELAARRAVLARAAAVRTRGLNRRLVRWIT